MTDATDRVPIEPQSIVTPLSKAAVFLVLTFDPAAQALTRVLEVISDIGALTRAVGFRDLRGRLSCNVGIGSDAWDRLHRPQRPAQLRRFAEIRGPVHTAPATAGDLLFHIRAERPDMCFDLERLLLQALGDCVTVEDEVQGFRYFDSRDLLGFVDGTENPTGSAIDTGWQEAIVGRSKLENVELEDAPGQESHKTLTTIVDEHGVEHDILRDNMPFGRPGHAEYGTYFIGYARNLWVIEQMLHNMFVGGKCGRHDRILDFSTAITGSTFFAPSNSLLMTLAG
jgi:porphyrinogen peroxidase